VACLPVGLFAEPIDIISQFHSLSKSRFQEMRMPQRPKRLLDQVRACPELAEGMQSVSSAMPTAPRRSTSSGPSDSSSVGSRFGQSTWRDSVFGAERGREALARGAGQSRQDAKTPRECHELWALAALRGLPETTDVPLP
jgi:hypothetical protein